MVVLDSWALLAYLANEPAAERIESAWIAEGAAMSSINLGEALYIRIRQGGTDIAAEEIAAIRARLSVIDPDWKLVTAAAEVKALGGLSYADAFCVATARRLDVPLLTGDPEIVALDGELKVIDLR